MSQRIEHEKLSKRTSNIIKNAGVQDLEELKVFFFSKKLHNSINAGKKVVNEVQSYLLSKENIKSNSGYSSYLKEDIHNLFKPSKTKRTQLQLLYSFLDITTVEDAINLDLDLIENIKLIKYLKSKIPSHYFELVKKNNQIKLNFHNIFNISLIDVSDSEITRKALLNRLINGNTLDESGKEAGITRERVRQLESRFLNNMKYIVDDISLEIAGIVKSSTIESIFELEKIIPCASGISSYFYSSSNPGQFLDLIFKTQNNFRIELTANDVIFIARNSYNKSELFAEFKIFLEGVIKIPNDIESIYKGFCISNDREDLISKSHSAISYLQKNQRFFIETVLKEYRSFNDIIIVNDFYSYISKKYKSTISKRRVESVLSTDIENFFTLNQGKYIFIDDIKFSKEQINVIQSKAASIVMSDPSRSFSVSNICSEVKDFMQMNSIFALEDINYLSPQLLNAMLKSFAITSNAIKDMGRMQWTSGDINKRIELYPAAIKALELHGEPLSNTEIKKAIHKIRGVASFQLHTTKTSPDIVKLTDGRWGLRFRDVNLPIEKEVNLVKSIIRFLKENSKIIELTNFLKLREDSGIPDSCSNKLILNLLARHIPSGGRLGNPDFLMKKGKTDVSFIIFDPTCDDSLINGLCATPDKDNWSIEKIHNLLIDNDIASAEGYEFWLEKNKTLARELYLPQKGMQLYHFSDFIGFEALKEIAQNPSKKSNILAKKSIKHWNGKEFWSLDKIEKFFEDNEIYSINVYQEWRRLNKPEKKFLPSMIALPKTGFRGFQRIKDKLGIINKTRERGARQSTYKNNYWSIEKIESFFIENEITSEPKYEAWRRLGLPEKKYIPSRNFLKKHGFSGFNNIRVKALLKTDNK